jgi:mRNA interferase MazF
MVNPMHKSALRLTRSARAVVPLTTRDRGLDHHVQINSPGTGLSRPSWARTEDVTAVSVQRFVRPQPLGRVSGTEVERLSEWLREMVAFA